MGHDIGHAIGALANDDISFSAIRYLVNYWQPVEREEGCFARDDTNHRIGWPPPPVHKR